MALTPLAEDAYMLVDEQYPYVFSLLCKPCECILNLVRLGLLVDDQEISLRIWRLCDMTDTSQKQACDRTECVSDEDCMACFQSWRLGTDWRMSEGQWLTPRLQ